MLRSGICTMTKIHENQEIPPKLEYLKAIILSEELLDKTLKQANREVLDLAKHVAKIKGKGIRTKLLLIAAMDGDGFVPVDAPRLCTAIEILHLATLVHDDIMDDAKTRRGIESVQSKFGKRQAVIFGDYLISMSFSLLTEAYQIRSDDKYRSFLPKFSSLISKICLGELKQFKNNGNTELTILEYLRIISGKTAALFHISAYAGALISDCDENDINLISRFGRDLGMFFQIIDDCKDYDFNEETAQKTVKNDIEQGVVTLPLIMAMYKEPELRILAKQVALGDVISSQLISEVHRVGGTHKALDFGVRYFKKAESAANNLKNSMKRNMLIELLETSRDAYSDILECMCLK